MSVKRGTSHPLQKPYNRLNVSPFPPPSLPPQMSPSDIQPRCFSGIPFWKVFRRRDPATAPVYTHPIPSPPSNRGTDHVVRVLHAYSVFQTLNIIQKHILEKDWPWEKAPLPPYSDSDWNHSVAPTVLSSAFVNTIETELDDLNDELRVVSLGIHGVCPPRPFHSVPK